MLSNEFYGIVKNKRYLRAFTAPIVLFFGLSAHTAEMGLYNLKLANLKNFTQWRTAELQGSWSVWVAVQPNCESCKKQLKNLGCLSPEVKTLILGVKGSREQLQKSLRPLALAQPVVMATRDLEKYLGLAGTPNVMLVDKNGKRIKSQLGVSSCEEIQSWIKKEI